MSRLPFEAFLALRYLRPRRTFVSVITVISILGVMLGVAVLIVVISVMSGFDAEWRARILGFNAHLKLYQVGEGFQQAAPLARWEEAVRAVSSNRWVRGAAPFVQGQVMVKTQPPAGGENPKVCAPLIRGVDAELEGKVSCLPRSLVAGKFDVRANGLLVGREFAESMNLTVGDKVLVYSPGNLAKMDRARGTGEEEIIVPDEYVVQGIFDVGYSEYNASIVVASLGNAQRLFHFEDGEVHGVQIILDDPFHADRARTELLPELAGRYRLETWLEENPHLFEALAVEKNMMFFLLFFIMIVAGFGIVNSQITFVVQKTREIGILKSLGARNAGVLALFLSQSVVVGVMGVASGFGLAMLALAYRNEFLRFMSNWVGFDLLPASIYQVYDLPAVIQTSDILIICGTAFVTCVMAGLFPAWKASRLQPVEALRHE